MKYLDPSFSVPMQPDTSHPKAGDWEEIFKVKEPVADFDTWWEWFSTDPDSGFDEEMCAQDTAAEAFKAGWEWANERVEW